MVTFILFSLLIGLGNSELEESKFNTGGLNVQEITHENKFVQQVNLGGDHPRLFLFYQFV